MSPKPDETDGLYRTRIPADIGAPDKIAWGLSFRQLAIIGTVALAGWLLYSRFGPLLPPMVWVIAAIPVAAVTVVVALGRRDGLPLDVWLRHGLALRRVPKVQAPGRTRTGQALVETATPVKVPAPLRQAATTIAADGTLTVDGKARSVIACGTTNVALRTGGEQAALLGGFGQWLNALTGPAHDATIRALGALGVAADPLDGPAVTAALASAVDPYNPPVPGPRAVPGIPITTRRTP